MPVRSALLSGLGLFVFASAYGLDFADPDWEWRLPGSEAAVSFRALDTDRDGVLTPTEARRIRLLADRFTAADIDRDGVLSALEFNHAALGARPLDLPASTTSRAASAIRESRALAQPANVGPAEASGVRSSE